MIQVNMPAEFRNVFGKGASRQLRMDGKTPAVIYSGGADAVALQCDAGELFKHLLDIHGQNALITLDIKGDEKDARHVLVQEVQKNPVTDHLIHVDFLEIELEQPASFDVPIKFIGTPKGVDLGGDMHILSRDIQLKGLPLDIPDFVEVNVKSLDRGDSMSFDQITLPDNLEMLSDGSETFIAIY